jgi:putative hemolysin
MQPTLHITSTSTAHPLRLLPATELRLSWARHPSEVREAQRLRHTVFAEEKAARLRPPPGTLPGLDVDLYDAHCEHLLVRAVPLGEDSGPVVATYRVLLPEAAQRVGGLYAEQRFDLTRVRAHRAKMAELGRACVHADHRRGAALLMMWGEIAAMLARHGVDYALGSVSLCARDGGAQAWAIWQQVAAEHLAPLEWQVRSRSPLPRPLRAFGGEVSVDPLLRGYLKLNGQLLGEPAWDDDFQCADLPMMVRLNDLPGRFRRQLAPGARWAA